MTTNFKHPTQEVINIKRLRLTKSLPNSWYARCSMSNLATSPPVNTFQTNWQSGTVLTPRTTISSAHCSSHSTNSIKKIHTPQVHRSRRSEIFEVAVKPWSPNPKLRDRRGWLVAVTAQFQATAPESCRLPFRPADRGLLMSSAAIELLVSIHLCSADYVKSIRVNKSQCDYGLRLRKERDNIVDHIRLIQYTQLSTSSGSISHALDVTKHTPPQVEHYILQRSLPYLMFGFVGWSYSNCSLASCMIDL